MSLVWRASISDSQWTKEQNQKTVIIYHLLQIRKYLQHMYTEENYYFVEYLGDASEAAQFPTVHSH